MGHLMYMGYYEYIAIYELYNVYVSNGTLGASGLFWSI